MGPPRLSECPAPPVYADNLAVTKTLFDGVEIEKGKLMKGQLIASQFLAQLHKLTGIINVRTTPTA